MAKIAKILARRETVIGASPAEPAADKPARKPTVDRTVLLKLSPAIIKSARDFGMRTELKPGDVVPAIVLMVHNQSCINVRAQLGVGELAVSFVTYGQRQGQWSWPD